MEDSGKDEEVLAHCGDDLAPRVRAGVELLVEVAEEWKRQSTANSPNTAEQTRFARVQLEGLHRIRLEYMDDFMRYLQSLDALLGRLHATTRQKERSPDAGGE